MFSFTHDKFNFAYTESSINGEIDAIASLFDLKSDLDCFKQLKALDSLSFVCWNDQRRIAKCIVFILPSQEYLLFLKPRLEFILTYDFISFIESIRDHVFSLYSDNSKSIKIVFSDLSQGVKINNFLPSIDRINWHASHLLA